jgi:hypothetical protein
VLQYLAQAWLKLDNGIVDNFVADHLLGGLAAISVELRERHLYVRIGLLETFVKIRFGFVEFNED